MLTIAWMDRYPQDSISLAEILRAPKIVISSVAHTHTHRVLFWPVNEKISALAAH